MSDSESLKIDVQKSPKVFDVEDSACGNGTYVRIPLVLHGHSVIDIQLACRKPPLDGSRTEQGQPQ